MKGAEYKECVFVSLNMCSKSPVIVRSSIFRAIRDNVKLAVHEPGGVLLATDTKPAPTKDTACVEPIGAA
jgi:hypothetical protein